MSIAFKFGKGLGNAGRLAVVGVFAAGAAIAKAGSSVVDGAHSFAEGVGDGFADRKVNRRKPKAPVAQPAKPAATKKAAAPVRRTRAKAVAA